MLMFTSQPSSQVSLEDLANEFCEVQDITISKQAIHERFNDYAVLFMQSLFEDQLSRQLSIPKDTNLLRHFTRLRIKDSTRFSLPKEYASVYKGHGGAGGPAQISIQFEYDMIQGKIMHLELTSANRNDQQDAKETLHDIEKGDLLIRDLGYTSKEYIKHVTEKEAYYLNRLNPRLTVYDRKGEAIDYAKILKKINRYDLTHMEIEIFLWVGDKWIPSRLIISKVNEATYKKRLDKVQKENLRRGHNLSKAYKISAWLNLLMTNIPQQWLATKDIQATYGLRWQIELIFKVWKSQTNINKLKMIKIQRFQCELLARLLWILLHWQLLRLIQSDLNSKISVWKFYKVAYRLSSRLKLAILNQKNLISWFGLIYRKARNKYRIEPKNGKPEISMTLINVLV